MTTPNHPTTGETLEHIIEGVIFSDPVTHRLKVEWETSKHEVQELFEEAFREQHQERLDYHRTCQAPNAAELAKAEASALRILLIEERDQRLGTIWTEILRRVNAVLADNQAVCEDTDSAGNTTDNADR